MDENVLSLSLDDYTRGLPKARFRFLSRMEEGLYEVGFLRYRDHGIDNELLARYYEMLRIFFVEWTEKQRMQMEQAFNGRQRGYGPFACEHAAGTDEFTGFDRKTFFSLGTALDPSHPRFDEIAVNIYPDIPGFRRVADEVYEQISRARKIIFAAKSEILGMGPDWLPRVCESGDNMFRALYYPGPEQLPKVCRDRAEFLRQEKPPEDEERRAKFEALVAALEKGELPPDSSGSGAHTDIDVGTILPRASAKGLWAETRSGTKIAVHGDGTEILYQTGDTTEDMSGGYLRSAVHGVDNDDERISAVCFGHADRAHWVDIVPPMRAHATKSVTPATERRKLILRLHEIGHTGLPLPPK